MARPVSERAAPRWVSCRSMAAAMLRSVTCASTHPGRSESGDARMVRPRRSTRVVPMSTPYSEIGPSVVRTRPIKLESGLPNGTTAATSRPTSWLALRSKNCSAAGLAKRMTSPASIAMIGSGRAERIAAGSIPLDASIREIGAGPAMSSGHAPDQRLVEFTHHVEHGAGVGAAVDAVAKFGPAGKALRVP